MQLQISKELLKKLWQEMKKNLVQQSISYTRFFVTNYNLYFWRIIYLLNHFIPNFMATSASYLGWFSISFDKITLIYTRKVTFWLLFTGFTHEKSPQNNIFSIKKDVISTLNYLALWGKNQIFCNWHFFKKYVSALWIEKLSTPPYVILHVNKGKLYWVFPF